MGELVGQAFVVGFELGDLLSQRHRVLVKGLELAAQARSLACFVNGRSSEGGEHGGDKGLLQCCHGDSFDGGCGGGGGESSSSESSRRGNGNG